jgi:hypothetical protein
MMKVSIQRKRRGADVIATSIRSDGETLRKTVSTKPMFSGLMMPVPTLLMKQRHVHAFFPYGVIISWNAGRL